MSMMCFNYDCDRELSEYEMLRLNPVKFSKYRFCKKCRQHQYVITRVRCDQCECPFVQDTVNRMYCDTCKDDRRKYQNRNRGDSNKLRSTSRFIENHFKKIRDSLFKSWVMMETLK